MRIGLSSLGVILIVLGTIWFLQGINVLPGSFMTGQIRWAIIGAIVFGAGIALLLAVNRRGLTGGARVRGWYPRCESSALNRLNVSASLLTVALSREGFLDALLLSRLQIE